MHPAFSVIFFTVSSGAGLGLLALLYLADLLKLGGGLSPMQITVGGAIAVMLVGAGFVSSTFHLANPKNAWRAISRFRTSWLSREGVFGIVFFPIAFIYLGLSYLDIPGLDDLRLVIGALATLIAWATLFSTGMIYGCLKTIKQWHTPLVPVNYLVLGHFSGALLLLLIAGYGDTELGNYVYLSIALLVFSAVLKGVYYFWIAEPSMSTINTATGFTRGKVKLLDAGHTHGTFLTQEFGFRIARQHAVILKLFVFAAGFVIPLVLLGAWGASMALLAVILTFLGLIAERWLFFAEARHVINLYHGAQSC